MDLWQSAGSNQTGSNQIKPRASGYSLGMAKSGCFAGLCELTYICIIYTYFTYYIFILFRCCNMLQYQRTSMKRSTQHSIACSQLPIVNNSKRTTWNNAKGPESAKLHLMHAVSQYSFPTQCIDSFYLSTHIWPLQA